MPNFFNARYMINYRAINEKLSRYKWETCEVARVWLSRTCLAVTHVVSTDGNGCHSLGGITVGMFTIVRFIFMKRSFSSTF